MEVGQGGIWTRSLVGLGFCVCVGGWVCVRVCVVLFFVILQRVNRFRF